MFGLQKLWRFSRVGSVNFPLARKSASTVFMTERETLVARKRRGPAPTGKGQQVVVRLQPEDLELLDLWITANDLAISRPDAMRRILRMVAMRLPKSAALERYAKEIP